jgi:hypothetical protein
MTVKKKGSPSKRKGNSWERDICKFLEEKLGGNYVRVPSSGAFVGRSNAFRKETMSENQKRTFRGDIIPPDNLPKMVIEAKSYKEFPFHQLLSGKCALLDDWVEQTIDCIENGDIWFVIFKINNKGSFVATTNNGYAYTHYCQYKDLVITGLDDFFTNNKDRVIEICS